MERLSLSILLLLTSQFTFSHLTEDPVGPDAGDEHTAAAALGPDSIRGVSISRKPFLLNGEKFGTCPSRNDDVVGAKIPSTAVEKPGDPRQLEATPGETHRIAVGRPRRVLVVDCMMDGSHMHVQRLMARELARRGHQVTWLTPKMMMYWVTDEDRKLMTFQTFDTVNSMEKASMILDYWTRKILAGDFLSFSSYAKLWLGLDPSFNQIKQFIKQYNADFFKNVDFDQLKSSNFDLVLCEIMHPSCSVVAHDVLRVPFVNTINGGYLGTRYSRWFNQPSPLAYVPEFMTHYTDDMTFPQRLNNVLFHWLSVFVYDWIMLGKVADGERETHGLSPGPSTGEILSRSELFLYNWDNMIEFPRPVTPNVVTIGGLTIAHPKPLPAEFEEFVQGSGEHGLVVFSVSTLLRVIEPDMANMIATALARLPQRVIWKYIGKEKPRALGKNTMAVPRIPQQDLMAHEKTHLLIYHGGLNGGYEAMYHGVPILGIPLFADQIDNLIRLKHVGMADYFRDGIAGLTSERLYQGIQEVLNNASLKENAVKASQRMRSAEDAGQGLPLNRTAYHLEMAMEHGTEHLRTRVEKLAWYEYWLVDVACVYIVTVVVIAWLAVSCCKVVVRLL